MTEQGKVMSDTPDSAEQLADLLPCCCSVQVSVNDGIVSSHGYITQGGHPTCPAFYRQAVAAALRTVAEREYGRGLEDAAKAMCVKCAAGIPAGVMPNSMRYWHAQPRASEYDDVCDAGPIHAAICALATGEQT